MVFIDTPGLAAPPNLKDEVLCHILGKKSQQILVELIRNDEVDLIIHLVLAGEQSAFSSLWRAVAQQCSADELVDLSERLVLAINGTNIYFTNRHLRERWSDVAVIQQKGDHFSSSLKDNILMRMSERGVMRPARVAFLDSIRFVGSGTEESYAQTYAGWKPVLLGWATPGRAGHSTLQELGIVESFKQNIEALCDPLDRGQGFLIRQTVQLIEQNGPKLFLRKNLKRNRLHSSIKKLRSLLLRCYDVRGRVTLQAIQEAVRKCLHFLDVNDLSGPKSIEGFARKHLDPLVEKAVAAAVGGSDPKKWVSLSFEELCKRTFSILLAQGPSGGEHQRVFKEYCSEKMNSWKRQWGYRAAVLPLPTPQLPYTADLVKHSLRFHAREMLFQLLAGDFAKNADPVIQDAQDQEQVRAILSQMEQLERSADFACQQCGVPLE